MWCWRSSSSSYSLTVHRPCGALEGHCALWSALVESLFGSGAVTLAKPEKDTQHGKTLVLLFILFSYHMFLIHSVFYLLFTHKPLRRVELVAE